MLFGMHAKRGKQKRAIPFPPPTDARSIAVLHTLNGRVPPIIFQFCQFVVAKVGLCAPFDCLELFAGRKAVTRGLRLLGYKAVAVERDDDSSMDFLSPHGFLQAACLALSLRKRGFLMAAPVCSSWVWLSRSRTGRSHWNPLGRGSCADKGNTMVARLAVLLRIVHVFDIMWVLEQPQGSLMERHPRIQDLCTSTGVCRSSWRMGDFGASSQKPTWLYANRSLRSLRFYRVRACSKTCTRLTTCKGTHDGRRNVQGNKEALRRSATYPRQFGEALSHVYRMFDTGDFSSCQPAQSRRWPKDDWADACLHECMCSV